MRLCIVVLNFPVRKRKEESGNDKARRSAKVTQGFLSRILCLVMVPYPLPLNF